MGNRVVDWVKAKVTGLSQLQDHPRSIARGVAAGTFFGFIPLFGFKTLLAMGSAKLFRGNVVASAVAVTLHDVILPLAPVLLRWEYQIGYWLLSHPHHLPAGLGATHQGPSMWFHWDTLFSVGLPLMLGAILVAIPFTLAAYFLTLMSVKRAKKEPSVIIVP